MNRELTDDEIDAALDDRPPRNYPAEVAADVRDIERTLDRELNAIKHASEEMVGLLTEVHRATTQTAIDSRAALQLLSGIRAAAWTSVGILLLLLYHFR